MKEYSDQRLTPIVVFRFTMEVNGDPKGLQFHTPTQTQPQPQSYLEYEYQNLQDNICFNMAIIMRKKL